MGGGEFFKGRNLVVRIETPGHGAAFEVTPSKRDGDGMADPPSLANSQQAEATPSELLAVLFSRDEVRILSEMLGEKALKAKTVQDGCKISESKFWVLWSNLQQRGVVVDAEEGEGFAVGPGWVKEWVRARSEGGGGGGGGARPAA